MFFGGTKGHLREIGEYNGGGGCRGQGSCQNLEGPRLVILLQTGKGLYLNIIFQFFKNLEIAGDDSVLKLKVSEKIVVVTLDHIASFLDYTHHKSDEV